MTATLIVRTLGGLSIQTPTGRGEGAATQPRRLALLAMIARAGDRGITRDKLLALLWPDAEIEQGRRALNQALYALRRDLGADELFVGMHELRLNPDVAACDVLQFESALRAGRFEDAAAHYGGPFLDGFRLAGAPEFERWADEERAELAHRLEGVLERLARTAAQRDEPLEAVRWWRRLAAIDPLDARVAAALMSALVVAGDCSAALQHARIYEVLVAQELDLPADGSVVELARRIRAGEIGAPVAAVPVAGPTIVLDDRGAASRAAVVAPAPAVVTEPAALDPIPRETVRGAPAAAALARELDPDGIAVLPFTRLGDDDCWFGDGVSEEIIHALTELPWLRVVARSTSFAFRGPAVDLADVAERLGVGRVIEGAVRQSGDEVRVTVRLVDVATRRPLWAERCDGALADAFGLQDEVAACVVERLRRERGVADERPARAHAGRSDAPDLVLMPGHPVESRARQVIPR
jgi:TolB-like protein/DNA-binding SARP family transcriptional activator